MLSAQRSFSYANGGKFNNMINPADPSGPDNPKRNPPKSRRRRPSSKPGIKKVFPRGEGEQNARAVTSRDPDPRHSTALSLPPGAVIQVQSPRMRSIVDTFLMNTSPTHTAFRSLLQGSSGGFQGHMDALVLARVEKDLCSAALAIVSPRKWLIHSGNATALDELLDAVPKDLAPSRLEGEDRIVLQALANGTFRKSPLQPFHEYVHFVREPRIIPHGPGGHHRLAGASDIPRLEEYAAEYEAEMGIAPPNDWDRLIVENRILLGVVEGTIASVAIRGAETLDHVVIEGVYTFKAFRRRGLAKKLVAALSHQAAGRGQTAAVIVAKDNKPGYALLEILQYHKTVDYLIVMFP